MSRALAALGLCLGLSACGLPLAAGVPLGVSGATAVATLGPLGTTAVVLTDAERTACDSQKLFNDIGIVAQATGHTTIFSYAQKASAIMGKGCIW